MTKNISDFPKVVSQDEWLEARRALLVKEKELTRARDALRAERQALPMVKINKTYTFEVFHRANAGANSSADGQNQQDLHVRGAGR